MAKAKKIVMRREYTNADVKELRAHSKAKTPVAKIAKLTKRTEGCCGRRRSSLESGQAIVARPCCASNTKEIRSRNGTSYDAVQQGFLDQDASADHLRSRCSRRYESIERPL